MFCLPYLNVSFDLNVMSTLMIQQCIKIMKLGYHAIINYSFSCDLVKPAHFETSCLYDYDMHLLSSLLPWK